MDEQVDEQVDKQVDEQVDGETSGQASGRKWMKISAVLHVSVIQSCFIWFGDIQLGIFEKCFVRTSRNDPDFWSNNNRRV